MVITFTAQLLFSADFRAINPSYAGANFTVGGLTFATVRLAAFLIAVALATALWLLLNRLPVGRAIRATAQNLTAARLHGVDPRVLYAVTFGIGTALAGAAGGLYGMVSDLTPYIGASLTAKSFVIAMIGGLNNPFYVILGGIFVGIAESLTALYIGPTYTDVISFSLLVIVLVLRPSRALRAA